MSDYETYAIPARASSRRDEDHVFDCDCGMQLHVEPMTECSRCGAHYEQRDDAVRQVAPPQFDVSDYGRGDN